VRHVSKGSAAPLPAGNAPCTLIIVRLPYPIDPIGDRAWVSIAPQTSVLAIGLARFATLNLFFFVPGIRATIAFLGAKTAPAAIVKLAPIRSGGHALPTRPYIQVPARGSAPKRPAVSCRAARAGQGREPAPGAAGDSDPGQIFPAESRAPDLLQVGKRTLATYAKFPYQRWNQLGGVASPNSTDRAIGIVCGMSLPNTEISVFRRT